jgi:hypothetical protein
VNRLAFTLGGNGSSKQDRCGSRWWSGARHRRGPRRGAGTGVADRRAAAHLRRRCTWSRVCIEWKSALKALSLSADERLALRQRVSARLIEKLHRYLLELQPEVLSKRASVAAVRYG